MTVDLERLITIEKNRKKDAVFLEKHTAKLINAIENRKIELSSATLEALACLGMLVEQCKDNNDERIVKLVILILEDLCTDLKKEAL